MYMYTVPDDTLSEYAYRQGLEVGHLVERAERKHLGQFMTPPPIAQFMARHLLAGWHGETVRILEPAAGTGALIAAAVVALCKSARRPRRIEVLAYEIDDRLAGSLRDTCNRCRAEAERAGIELVETLRVEDFLLSPLARAQRPVADLLISNPPFFKLSAADPRALAHAYAVHGQPNIYGLFMASCAALLHEGGKYCFITPRSWTSGPYFAAVRRHLFGLIGLDALHVFDSRTEQFEDGDVLQETIVTCGTAHAARPSLRISRSAGIKDLERAETDTLPTASVVRGDDRVIMLPHRGALHGPSRRWTQTLGTLGLKVSTGPTVAFRARAHMRDRPGQRTVPLLWMQHVKRLDVRWPMVRSQEHIEANAASSWMMLHNEPMVLMRRFSPKEDTRRMTAAAYLGDLPCNYLALENHLNYIHRPGGSMTAHEARGLAAVLSSDSLDLHFRAVSGNTQINATELRAAPLPDWETILGIADRLANTKMTLDQVDLAVNGEAVVT